MDTTRTPVEALLASAREGDVAALNQLIAEHRNGVYRFGLKVCRTTEDTEDAVQETLWAATRALRTFRGSAASLASWLFTIVRRECLRLLEGHRRRPAPFDAADEVVAEGHDVEGAIVTREQTEQLARALARLDPLHREVVLLRDIREMTAPEAASALGISIDALKSRLHRARDALRTQMIRENEPSHQDQPEMTGSGAS